MTPFVPGGGGGAGGAISISATTVDATGGVVSVQGGAGGSGAGGGGGGGGGIFSVVAPVTLNLTPQTGGGPGGGHVCDLAPQGADGHGQGFNGAGGVIAHNNDPASRAESTPNAYWFKGASVPVPITAAAAITPTSHNFTVVLCGMNRGPGASDPDSMGKTPQDFGFTMPSRVLFFGPAVDQPCGFGGASELAHTDYNGQSQTAVGATMTANSLSTGYEAVWTIIMKSDDDSVSCYHGGTAAAPHCFVENIPNKPESIFGVDNDPPAAFTLTATPTVTNNPNITLHVSGVKDVEGHLHDDPSQAERVFSGVKAVDCSNDGSTFTQCDPVGNGDRAWTVTPGSGQKTVSVRVTDQAGNTTTENVTVTLDAVGPTVLASPDSGPDRANSWYSASPTFTIHWSKLLPPPFMAGPGSPAVQYHFDGGPAIPCSLDGSGNCHVTTGLPLHGVHTLYYQGFDAVGNVSAVQSVSIKIDGVAPKSALLGVPATPDGANNWYVHTTFFTVSTLDEPGGSGLVPGGSDTPGAGVYVAVDSPSFPATPTAPPVAPGAARRRVSHRVLVCAGRRRHLDLGGSGFVPSVAQALAAGQCKSVMVDTGAPAVSILPTPASPNASGWYTQTVAVAVAANDGIQGFRRQPRLRRRRPARPLRPAAQGHRPETVGYLHLYRRRAVRALHRAGDDPGGHPQRPDVRRRRVRPAQHDVELPIYVDLSPPVATARTRPPDPALGPWFRTLPTVVLRAVDGDQNSGVASIQYRLDGGPVTTYTGPFTVPESPPVPRTVTYWATDTAGLVQPARTLTLPVDQTPPVVAATTPTPAHLAGLLSAIGNLLGLSPPTAQLNWTVSDNTSPHVHITVLVYNATGAVVRQLDGGTYATTPNTVVNGSTAWDGKDQTITGVVPVGLYYYRVVATDDAGNIAQSGESSRSRLRPPSGCERPRGGLTVTAMSEPARRSPVWIVLALVAGVGIGVLGTVLIVGTGGDGSLPARGRAEHDGAARDDHHEHRPPRSDGTGARRAPGPRQHRPFHARYTVVSPTAQGQGATVSLEVWRSPPLVRQDTVVTAQGKTTDTAAFALPSGVVQCTKTDPAAWSCQAASAPGSGLADLSTLTQRITAQLATATVTVKDDSVGGRPARCFTVTLDANSTVVCVDAGGVPLLEASGGSQLQLQTLDSDIPTGTFAPPAKVA